MKTQEHHFAKDALFGLAVGDALGVPVEFNSRAYLKEKPVKEMLGFGTHHQPAGTWSDDSSLAFCLAESLCEGFDLQDIANRFANWYQHGYWTPYGEVFDIGTTTIKSLKNLENGANPLVSGCNHESDNGNGSLMRTLPLIFYLQNKSIEERFGIVGEVSAITHGHIRSVLACFIYCEIALELLTESDKFKAFQSAINRINAFEILFQNYPNEMDLLQRILNISKSLHLLPENEILSDGYVLHTLEAAIWCWLNSKDYPETVLKAVNLGSDTDTTACVAGGLAGLTYGFEAIPSEWINILARKEDIEILAEKLKVAF